MTRNQANIPCVSREQYTRILGKREYEDLELIEKLERTIRSHRTYIFRMPKPGTNVILLFSGGIDSTVAWYILATHYKLQVYPLFVTPSLRHPQVYSVGQIGKYYSVANAQYYYKPFSVTYSFLPKEFRTMLDLQKMHPDSLLHLYHPRYKLLYHRSGSGLNTSAAWLGMLYAQYLWLTQHAKINTIFSAITSRDGIEIPSQTLTYIRLTNVSLMQFTQDHALQYTSLFLERELGHFAAKRDIIQIGVKHDLPLHLTTSCYSQEIRNCGRCLGCITRKQEFKRSGIKDETFYEDKVPQHSLREGIAIIRKAYYHILRRGR